MAEYEYGGKNTKMFERLPGYKKIVAWQVASDLNFEISQLVKRFGHGHYELADQMRRSAISVSGNIAEGYCLNTLPNYIRHCNIGRGSLGELGSYLQDCERDKLATGEILDKLVKQYSLATYFLDRLIAALQKKLMEEGQNKNARVKEVSSTYMTEADDDIDPRIIFPDAVTFSEYPLSPL